MSRLDFRLAIERKRETSSKYTDRHLTFHCWIRCYCCCDFLLLISPQLHWNCTGCDVGVSFSFRCLCFALSLSLLRAHRLRAQHSCVWQCVFGRGVVYCIRTSSTHWLCHFVLLLLLLLLFVLNIFYWITFSTHSCEIRWCIFFIVSSRCLLTRFFAICY